MSSSLNRHVDDARAIFDAAVDAAQADRLLEGGDWDCIGSRRIASYDRVFVVGMGKASLAMASVLESRFNLKIADGVVVVPPGYPASLPSRLSTPSRIKIFEGGHPLPNEDSRRAADRILALAGKAGEGDLVVALISGGGSALCANFADAISLDDAKATYKLLLNSGADIYAMNSVRKHITRVGGGRLAQAASPADVLGLIVSDVVGDDLSVIASGPTSGDPTTFADAKHVLEEKEIWSAIPVSVRSVIDAGTADASLETPVPGSGIFSSVTNRILGSNEAALDAAAEEARKRGFGAEIIATGLTGEAREVGPRLVQEALDHRHERQVCLIAGGETTVTVSGTGRGGRNQEMTLAASIALQGIDRDVVFLSGGTDGVDGPTDAAGAWATPSTVQMAKKRGFDARAYLNNNDSYTFFLHAGSLLKTGHTHTNVMDVQVILLS